MEIRNNRIGSSGADHIDLTKANREAIRETAPNPPVPPEPAPIEDNAVAGTKRIARARDEFAKAESVHTRIANARDRFESVQTRVQNARDRFESVQTRVENARDRFESVQTRVENARDRFESVHKRIQGARSNDVEGPEDKLTLSNGAKQLAETTITRPADADATARAQLVNELRAQHGSGQLDVESLVAESAYRMLSGE